MESSKEGKMPYKRVRFRFPHHATCFFGDIAEQAGFGESRSNSSLLFEFERKGKGFVTLASRANISYAIRLNTNGMILATLLLTANLRPTLTTERMVRHLELYSFLRTALFGDLFLLCSPPSF